VESIFLDETDEMVRWNIEQIKDLGIDIEIDDFGTGYASIVSLMQLKPYRLKIARQLVEPIVDSVAQRRLLASIVDIGRALGIEVLGEGVETEAHARILCDLGCASLQGYLLARPMPASELPAFAAARSWLSAPRRASSIRHGPAPDEMAGSVPAPALLPYVCRSAVGRSRCQEEKRQRTFDVSLSGNGTWPRALSGKAAWLSGSKSMIKQGCRSSRRFNQEVSRTARRRHARGVSPCRPKGQARAIRRDQPRPDFGERILGRIGGQQRELAHGMRHVPQPLLDSVLPCRACTMMFTRFPARFFRRHAAVGQQFQRLDNAIHHHGGLSRGFFEFSRELMKCHLEFGLPI